MYPEDSAFFAAHPMRTWRLRHPYPGEGIDPPALVLLLDRGRRPNIVRASNPNGMVEAAALPGADLGRLMAEFDAWGFRFPPVRLVRVA